MEKSLKKSSDSERYLPSDILFMVLVLLPTKLLLQMRSVCKLWRDIISDCSFIKAHLDRANDIHNNSLKIKRYMDNAVCTRSTGFEESWTRYELTIPMKQFSPSVEILASCNGLLLFGDDIECYYLWNPSTRLLKQFNGPSVYRDELRNFALGYDNNKGLQGCKDCAFYRQKVARFKKSKIGSKKSLNEEDGLERGENVLQMARRRQRCGAGVSRTHATEGESNGIQNGSTINGDTNETSLANVTTNVTDNLHNTSLPEGRKPVRVSKGDAHQGPNTSDSGVVRRDEDDHDSHTIVIS
ncbi:F-box associated domain containing protein [Tanacetum coccineum]